MNPLHSPKQWPPPDEPPPTAAEIRWARWPIVGIIPCWFLAGRRRSHHLWNVLEPIEKDIVLQLVHRAGDVQWPSGTHTAVAMMISAGVGAEKSIGPPPIMPGDGFDLLFWGAYDDMTALVFALAFEEQFGCEIPLSEFLEFHTQRKTVGEFVEHCVLKINQRAEAPA